MTTHISTYASVCTFQPICMPECKRRDHDQRRAQIHVRRGPALHRAHGRAVTALANAEQRQPDDQQRADRAEHIALPRAAVGRLRVALRDI